MLTQYYKILGSNVIDQKVKAGQFVISSNEDERNILGFVYKVSDASIDIVLWEVTEVGDNPNIISIKPNLTPQDIEKYVTEMLTNNLNMIEIWQRAATNKLFTAQDYNTLTKDKSYFKTLEK